MPDDITKQWLDASQPYYDAYMPYPTVTQAEVSSGLRKNPRSCQYFVSNLPPICSNWNRTSEQCGVSISNKKPIPTSYNNKKCDGLGRASKCSYYSSSSTTDTEWVCIAPCMERSGLLKKLDRASELYVAGPVPEADIGGYNKTDGVGVCDGEGYGTGKTPGVYDLEKLDSFPRICKYYRPWSMGFGAVDPKPGLNEFLGSSGPSGPKSSRVSYKTALKDLQSFDKRLPYGFEVYNYRAKYQKCMYWDSTIGGHFQYDAETQSIIVCKDGPGGNDVFFTENFGLCTNREAKTEPYRFSDFDNSGQAPSFDQLITTFIWSTEAGGYVCNGAKPECPCYTGNWNYCVDAQMKTGMRITANQILELRFWASNWEDKSEYDDFFQQRPSTNPNDPTTSKIYTFSRWKDNQSLNVYNAIMEGYSYDMCLPAPIWNRDFDFDTYIEKQKVTYPRMSVETGTRGSNDPSFPTLIRSLNLDIGIQPLDIFYPYKYKDHSYYETEACSKPIPSKPYTKRSHSLDGDSIIIVGATTPQATVYVFNYVDDEVKRELPGYIKNNRNARKLSAADKEDVFKDIDDGILELRKLGTEYYVSATADFDGSFITDPIKLDYNKLNTLIIIAKFSDGSYEWRKRDVYSSWTGGVVVQTGFNCSESGGNNLPAVFIPNAEVRGKAVTLGDTSGVSSIMNVSSVVRPSLFGGDVYYYSYCLRVKTVTANITKWARIGNSNRIWAEIDDINLNYIFTWTVEEAKMSVLSDGSFCGEVGTVNMDVLYPTTHDDQINFLPNGCILEPEDPSKFYKLTKDNCSLSITYKYTYLSNSFEESDNDSILFPTNYVELTLKHSLEVNYDTFIISGIIANTPAIMALFYDEERRVCASFATHMLVNVVHINCRSVEIEYKYEADGIVYLMDPSSGFRTRPFTPHATGETRTHYEVAPCGDHSCNPYDCEGPMWFPFTSCAAENLYILHRNAAFCVGLYPGCKNGRPDMRFCHVVLNDPWVEPGGNWLSACGVQWAYYYSKVDDGDPGRFAGFGATVSRVSSAVYSFWDWDMPPFGNDGRDIIERYMSQDHMCHFNARGDTVCEWMPYAIDNRSFYMSCNSMEQGSNTTGIGNVYTPIHQLNMLRCSTISESISKENERWEDVVGVDGVGNASYPYPYRSEASTFVVNFYHFKQENYAWLWQNFWKPIERVVSGDKLRFVKFEQPEYQYDIYKAQHRYICEEGEWDITYTPPIIEEGVYTTHPSIKLGAGEPRFFEIRYNDTWDSESISYISGYTSEQVDWRDESSDGSVDGSGGDGGGGNDGAATVYEETSPNSNTVNNANDAWDHDENIIFDGDAVRTMEAAEAADRKRLYSSSDIDGDKYRYFNRGLIANITRDSLRYLPYDQQVVSFSETSDTESDYGGVYLYAPPKSPTIRINHTDEGGFCPSTIIINGKWGETRSINYEEKVLVCKPGISITGMYQVEPGTDYGLTRSIYSSSVSAAEKLQSYEDFEITINLDINPLYMTTQRLNLMDIGLSGASGQWIYITGISILEAVYSGKTERINVYERKYTVSTYSTVGENLDGPGKHLYFRPQDGSNLGGVYFPLFSDSFSGETRTRNKIRSVAAGVKLSDLTTNEDGSMEHEVKEMLNVDINNLLTIEAETQKDVYESTINREGSWDTTNYSIKLPPQLTGFMDQYNIKYPTSLGSAIFNYSPSKWGTLTPAATYDGGYPFWHPKGHYWRNGDEVQKETCWFVGGYAEDLYTCKFIHADTDETTDPINPLTSLYWSTFSAYSIYLAVNDYSKGGRGFGETGFDALPVGHSHEPSE